MLQYNFVETKLKTKYGEFNIRVYPDEIGRENFVLWTEDLNLALPILVRVHSECITGDLLQSLHCDCGNQLSKSLHIISEQGGVLIYLRQEGRGIGLFEKMKAYQLQAEGCDTFEANIRLGHLPDQRSYEMVKTILGDLEIHRIRLLTNNPSKVSDIAKMGLEIVERVPLISRANKYNKAYLETKRKKFQHLSEKSKQYYFYQVHVDTQEHVKTIIKFLKEKHNDPLLQICIGISANHFSLGNEIEIRRINSIINACLEKPNLIPVIHFSFRDSPDTIEDAERIRQVFPRIKRLQLNDLPSLEVSTLKRLGELFLLDIPLTNESFRLVDDPQFRKLVLKNNYFILLDNSKGRGIKETKASFMKKLDILLAYGIKNIALCGGFGPDELDVYFELRRYYRVNFSIDAESNLKTGGIVDVEKAQLYLLQLIRFDDPKLEGVEQTRKFLQEHQRFEWEKAVIANHEFMIHPKVFHAGHFPSSEWFASELCGLVKNDSDFCEIGCGSGVISCLVALANPSLQITATDMSPFASENTQLNAEHLGVSSRIQVMTGDVLDSVMANKPFDSIFWALPFGFLDPGTRISLEETQVFDPGYRSIRKLFQTARNYLKPNGKLWLGFSTDLGHYELLTEIAKETGIELAKVRETRLKEDTEIRFQIIEGRIPPPPKSLPSPPFH